jgi:signal transduction histidine kinase
VRDLRVAESPEDLRAVLEEKVGAAGLDPAIPVHIVGEGAPRVVHPVVSAEIGRIASEALFNIARHAQARSVEITISFASHQLGVWIRDDGVGIADEVMAAGRKPGHFGLVGMRERAQRIGGVLTIESRPGAGAAVILKLPARLAYADKAPARSWLPALFRRSRSHPVV